MTTVLLARHGETAWNRNRRAQGWAPIRLNDRGRAQASALAGHLGERYDLDRIHASDLDRTAETARIVCQEAFPHLDPVIESYWRERDLGVYQGLTYEELSERYPAFALVGDRQRDPAAVPEGVTPLEVDAPVRPPQRGILDLDDATVDRIAQSYVPLEE
ncbi:MAG: histidine phosphatase family protein, partial [Halobacteriales archaeon]|nr:histidine phosphatase family protein [Halobacteriales archaeon]